MQTCFMPRLPSHLVQKLNVGTVSKMEILVRTTSNSSTNILFQLYSLVFDKSIGDTDDISVKKHSLHANCVMNTGLALLFL